MWTSLGFKDLAGGGDRGDDIWHLIAAAGFALMLVAFCIRSKVVVDDTGIRLRCSFGWRILIWANIAKVRPDYSSRYVHAYLASGRSERLLGLPVEVGTQLQSLLPARQPPGR